MIDDGESRRVRKGQGVLIFPHTSFLGESISNRALASVHHFVLDAQRSKETSSSLDRFLGKRRGFEFLDSEGDRRIDRDLERSIRLGDDQSDELNHESQTCLLRLVLLQLQVERAPISSSSRKTQIKLHRLLSWLAENISASIAVRDMAATVSISESHLRRLFRAEYGTGPARYFQEMKMREARRLLRESAEPIKAISSRLGFDDLPHFYRSFKNYTEMAPAEYRDRYSPIG